MRRVRENRESNEAKSSYEKTFASVFGGLAGILKGIEDQKK